MKALSESDFLKEATVAEEHKKKKKHSPSPFMVPLPSGMSDPTPTPGPMPSPTPQGPQNIQGAMANAMLQNLMSSPQTQHVAHHHFNHGMVGNA